MKKFVIIFILFVAILPFFNANTVKAKTLNDEVNDQIENIDFTEIEKFYNELDFDNSSFDFLNTLHKIISGDFTYDYSSIFEYVFSVFFSNLNDIIPIFLSMFAIGALCGIVKSFRGSVLRESVSEAVFFVCFLGQITLSFGLILSIYSTISKTINNICAFNEIISPILLTLMVASGGSVSASIFKPSVLFFSNSVVTLINTLILPMIALMFVFNIISQFNSEIKLTKYSDSIASIIKWILGLVFIIMGLFLTVQGIASGVFDGISFKATKYAISNSIPIVGGFLKDSFDLVASGSVLIKNAIGVAGIIGVFYIVISPLLSIVGASILFKLCSAFLEPISDARISGFCTSISKTLTYLTAVLLIVGVMFFITIMLMIICGNSALV